MALFQEIFNTELPKGIIHFPYVGKMLPEGWTDCDGKNGTPDLRKFGGVYYPPCHDPSKPSSEGIPLYQGQVIWWNGDWQPIRIIMKL